MINPVEHYEFGVNRARLIDVSNRGRIVATETANTGWNGTIFTTYNGFAVRSQQAAGGCCPISISMTMSPDGTKVFFMNHNGVNTGFGAQDKVTQFNITTPWDMTTMQPWVSSNSTTSAGTWGFSEASPVQIVFSSDGQNLYIAGRDSNRIYQFTLGTPYELSTAPSSPTNTKSMTADMTGVNTIMFSNDGTLMFARGASNVLYRYLLSSPWDITTASVNGSTLSNSASALIFKSDGTCFYGFTSNKLTRYYLSTPWDLSTYFTSENSPLFSSFSFNWGNASFIGMYMKPDGGEIFMSGYAAESVHGLTLTKPFAILGKVG